MRVGFGHLFTRRWGLAAGVASPPNPPWLSQHGGSTDLHTCIYLYTSPHLKIDPVAHESPVPVFARGWPACTAAALRRRGAPRSFGLNAPVRTTSPLRSRTCARTRRSGNCPLEYPWSTHRVPPRVPDSSLQYPLSTPGVFLQYPTAPRQYSCRTLQYP